MKQTNEFLKINDLLSIYVIGYESAGESIVVNLGNKFYGLVDCYKTQDEFRTLMILESLGVQSLDFICWSHTDEDHTLGLSTILHNFVDFNKTLFITPEGFQPKEYESELKEEYKEIFDQAKEKIKPSNHLSANHTFTKAFSFKLSTSSTPLIIEIKGYSPLSFIVKDLSLKSLKKYFSEDNKSRSVPNYFSITLKINVIHPDIAPISVCLTSDLDNYVIKRMDQEEAIECFSDNLLMKIPHHGSKNSNKLIGFINSLGYAATTSYKTSSLPLPEIIADYKLKNSIVSHTGAKTGHYGIIQYDILLKKHAFDNVNVKYYGSASIV